MNRIAAFFHWLGTPFRAVSTWFPFTQDGRQTLIYLMFSLSTGVLTLAVWWAMNRLFDAHQWQLGKQLAQMIAWALLISVSGYACFVSLRAINLGKDGFSVEGRDQPGGSGSSATTKTTTETVITQPAPQPAAADDDAGDNTTT